MLEFLVSNFRIRLNVCGFVVKSLGNFQSSGNLNCIWVNLSMRTWRMYWKIWKMFFSCKFYLFTGCRSNRIFTCLQIYKFWNHEDCQVLAQNGKRRQIRFPMLPVWNFINLYLRWTNSILRAKVVAVADLVLNFLVGIKGRFRHITTKTTKLFERRFSFYFFQKEKKKMLFF